MGYISWIVETTATLDYEETWLFFSVNLHHVVES